MPAASMVLGPQDSTLLVGLRPSPDNPDMRAIRWIDLPPGRGWTRAAHCIHPPHSTPTKHRMRNGASLERRGHTVGRGPLGIKLDEVRVRFDIRQPSRFVAWPTTKQGRSPTFVLARLPVDAICP